MTQRHEPSDETRLRVRVYSAGGIDQKAIASLIGVSLPTLHKYYRQELDDGMEVANGHVARSLFAKAVGNGSQSVTAAIFWLKARAGWRDRFEVEHTGKDGGPIQHQHQHTEESARDRIQRRIDRLAAGLPLLPAGVERDVAETEAQEDEA